MPSLRRKPTRPTVAIAFSTAFELSEIPVEEQRVLTATYGAQLTRDDLHNGLLSLGLEDAAFAGAIFELSNFSRHGEKGKKENIALAPLLLTYAVLRRLAQAGKEIDELRRAAEDALWLAFIAAAGRGPEAQFVTRAEWERLTNALGGALGGVDSLPAPDAIGRARAAWRFAHPRTTAMPWRKDSPLDFPRLIVAMRLYDAGLIVALRAAGVILTHAVQTIAFASGAQSEMVDHTTVNVPDLDAHATFLSQFVTVHLQRAINNPSTPSDSQPHPKADGILLQPTAEKQMPDDTHVEEIFALSNAEQPNTVSNASLVSESDAALLDTARDHVEFDAPDTSARHTATITSDECMDSRLVDPNGVSSDADADADNDDGNDDDIGADAEIDGTSRRTPGSSLICAVRRTRNVRRGKTPFCIDFSGLQLGEKIGSGSYGEVYRSTYLMSPVAVKVFHMNLKTPTLSTALNQNNLQRMSTVNVLQRFASANSQAKYREFVREVELMSVVRHPNLVLYMGACGDPFTPLCIVSELFTGGNLHTFLHAREEYRPSFRTAVSICLNIARGMYYLHSSQPSILHRDLKSRNVLLSGRRGPDGMPHVVICDFGLCQLFGEDGQSGPAQMGTAAYMSPDAINGLPYSAEDDVYSYGILMHEIFSGKVPYKGIRVMQLIFQVANCGLRPTSNIDNEMPRDIRELMVECWHEERSRRPSFDNIIAKLDVVNDDLSPY